MKLAIIIPATTGNAIKTPNAALNQTARKLRLPVPSALRASVAIRKRKTTVHVATAEQAQHHGAYFSLRLSEDGGLKQFVAYVDEDT
jgi:hypothetical protein